MGDAASPRAARADAWPALFTNFRTSRRGTGLAGSSRAPPRRAAPTGRRGCSTASTATTRTCRRARLLRDGTTPGHGRRIRVPHRRRLSGAAGPVPRRPARPARPRRRASQPSRSLAHSARPRRRASPEPPPAAGRTPVGCGQGRGRPTTIAERPAAP